MADTNVSLFARGATFVADTKMFLISFRNILRPQQMFPRLLAQEDIMSNNVSATMTLCPRLPPPVGRPNVQSIAIRQNVTPKVRKSRQCIIKQYIIIRLGFCDIRNNQDLDKCYQPQPSASADNTYLDLDYSG